MDLESINPQALEDFINNGGLSTFEVAVAPKSPQAPKLPPEEQHYTTGAVEPTTVTSTDLPDHGAVPLSIPQDFNGLDIRDPVELLIMLDDDVASGAVKLYKWQIQAMLDFAAGGKSDKEPIQQLIRAANGSGKDKYLIAPCVVWFAMRYMHARAVVTSSSGQQLDAQTCTYIDLLCNAANEKFQQMFGGPIWKTNYRYYQCLVTESPIDCYATDEPRKAEGYHPIKANAKMAIFVSEDKSVPDDINVAINKCTGYTHRMHVSTPGPSMGHFFEYDQKSIPRHTLKSVVEAKRMSWIGYHITAYDCTHLSAEYIDMMAEDLPGGRGGSAFRSQVMAEFGSDESMVVIPSHFVNKAVAGSKFGWKHKDWNDAGVDLADGGDETVLAVRNGNKLLHVIPFKFDNAVQTRLFLDEQFKAYGLNNPNSRINADCGGLGKPILDELKRMGWSNIWYIDNRNTPKQPRVYTNRAAELWFRFRKLLELGEIELINDQKTKTQLSNRFYSITPDNRHQLESKLKARSKGHPSPDRADAVILAFWEYEELTVKSETPPPFVARPVEQVIIPKLTIRELAHREDNPRYTKQPSANFKFAAINEVIAAHNSRMTSSESTD